MFSKLYSRLKRFSHRITGIELPHWTSFFIWLAGSLTLIAFTVRNLDPIIKNYLSDEENAFVKIKIQSNLTRIDPPELYICLPRLSTYTGDKKTYFSKIFDSLSGETNENCTICTTLSDHSWNVWDGKGIDWKKSWKLEISYIEKLYNYCENKSIAKNHPWKQTQLQVLFLDRLFNFTNNTNLEQYFDYYLDIDEWTKPILEVLMDFFDDLRNCDFHFHEHGDIDYPRIRRIFRRQKYNSG